MTTLQTRRLARFATVALAIALAGCAHGKRKPALTAPGEEAPASSTPESTTPTQPVDQGPDVQPVGGEGASASDIAVANPTVEGESGPLTDVRFDYDSAALSDAARATLDKHAAWLQAHREARVVVEGHCDERGTVEYNLALGEQRARATRDYLVSRGVAAERLRVVSYGKERPFDPAQTEEAYAKNRRAHFALDR